MKREIATLESQIKDLNDNQLTDLKREHTIARWQNDLKKISASNTVKKFPKQVSYTGSK